MKISKVKVGTPEYEKMLRDDATREAERIKQDDIIVAVSLLAQNGWTCIAPGHELPMWKKIKKGDRLPCQAYLWRLAYEDEKNFLGKYQVDGCLVPNEPVRVGCDTWYLPVDAVKNLPKEK